MITIDSMMKEELTPRQIVAELDKYIIGQTEAKKKRRHCIAQQVAPAKYAG